MLFLSMILLYFSSEVYCVIDICLYASLLLLFSLSQVLKSHHWFFFLGTAQLDYMSLTLSDGGPYLGCCSSLPDHTITVWWATENTTLPYTACYLFSVMFIQAEQLSYSSHDCVLQELGKCWANLFTTKGRAWCHFFGVQPSELAPALCFGH